MPEQPMEQQALGSWETEGGRVVPLLPGRTAPGEPNATRCLPTLPPGFEAQPLWGFSDESDRIFEFHRVYRAAALVRDHNLTIGGRLDQNLSYWIMSWTKVDESGSRCPAAQWLTYAEARQLLGPHLSFTQFSSQLQRWIPALLHMQARLYHA